MIKEIGPQEGPQEAFLSCPADICIYGGAAGGGKTYGMLLDALHYVHVPGFGAVFFRKNHNQIFSEGGLWDTSLELYSPIWNAEPAPGRSQWRFWGKERRILSKVSFAHIERDLALRKWQGSQIWPEASRSSRVCSETRPGAERENPLVYPAGGGSFVG